MTSLYNLCQTNGFSLKEHPLEGRLWLVLLNPKIIVKDSLEEEEKRSLVSKAVSYLLAYPNCQLAIFWGGEEQFFPL